MKNHRAQAVGGLRHSVQVLEHRICVGRFLRHRLQRVPMLDNLAIVIEPEYVDAGPVTCTRPRLLSMQDHVVSFGNGTSEVDMLAWVPILYVGEIVDEALFAIGYRRVMLDVDTSRIFFDGFGWFVLIKHQV